MYPSQKETRFYNWYFKILKKDGGLHPILDLWGLNHTLQAYRFKMLTVKLIVPQIQFKDWFVTSDIKDAFFHIKILPEHGKFLRFAFRGES